MDCFSTVIKKNVSNVFTFVSFKAVCGASMQDSEAELNSKAALLLKGKLQDKEETGNGSNNQLNNQLGD